MCTFLYRPKPKNGQISVSKVITGSPEDMTWFLVTLTGQSAEPAIVSEWVNQSKPIVFRNLPFDDYVVTEENSDGYTLDSITPDAFTLDRSNRNQEVEIVNDVAISEIKYGALYNWYAANNSLIAPVGYHVPSKTEIETLNTVLGGSGVSGGHLKEDGITHWAADNADNSSGFTSLPSGYRGSNGVFVSIFQIAYFWANTEYDAIYSYNFGQFYLATSNTIIHSNKKNGFSIRPIKDTTELSETGIVTDIDGNIYHEVKIGNQVWLRENLATTKLNNGTLIPNVTVNTDWAALTSEGYCWYDNDINNK